ncbi:MAG TPA: AMP-dependent synthetase [Flavobacteriaceae bacterium]|jgi:acyl-CoA synthetase (AMP-forming)/AMP-acid ligase II|nr:AMP-dependent synthetase [Flavobacteriaceae bacterium]HBS12642.1 AMP-dependent synthetase [Flavobacteriaceae bacterium]
MNIITLFLESARRYPKKTAIISKKKSIRYAKLEQEVKATASYFISKGIKKGDRVIVFIPMSIDLYRVVLALFYIGATAVFLDQWIDNKRLDLSCEIANSKGFIGVFKTKFLMLFSKELRKIPIKLKLNKQHKLKVNMAMNLDDVPALITFTTGSTGVPKAAERSHRFLKEQFNALLYEIKPKASDIDMPVLPIVLFMNLGVGCTSVIADFKMTKPEAIKEITIVNQIRKYAVNRIIASPFFVHKLAIFLIDKNTQLDTLKQIFTGGAPVFPREASVYLKAFPKTISNIVYGSTEVEPISSIRVDNLIQKGIHRGLPVGEVFYKAKVKIIKICNHAIAPCSYEQLNVLVVTDGEIGEIIVSGPHVLEKYFENEQVFKDNKVVVEGEIWHRTGDSGYLNKNELFLTGRCKQLIYNDAKLLSPFIIENKLQLIDGVTLGTLIKNKDTLILIVESILSVSELKSKIIDIPYDEIKILSKIPRDPRHNSKIDYNSLVL